MSVRIVKVAQGMRVGEKTPIEDEFRSHSPEKQASPVQLKQQAIMPGIPQETIDRVLESTDIVGRSHRLIHRA